MIDITVGSVGADYASLQLAIDSIPDNPAQGYRITVITNSDIGIANFDVPNASAVPLILTVAPAVRFYNAPSWPDAIAAAQECARIEVSAGEIGIHIVEPCGWEISWLAVFVDTLGSCLWSFDDSYRAYVHHCLFAAEFLPYQLNVQSSDGIYTWSAGKVVNCAFVGFNDYACFMYGDELIGCTFVSTLDASVATTLNAHGNVSVRVPVGVDLGLYPDFDVTVSGDYNISSDGSAPGLNSLTNQLLANVLVSANNPHLKTKGFLVTPNYQGSYPDMALDIDGQARSAVDPDAGADYVLAVTTLAPTTLPPTTIPPEGAESNLYSAAFEVPRLITPTVESARLERP